MGQVRQESNPDRRGWSSLCSVTPRTFESGADDPGRTGLAEVAPDALPTELRPHIRSAGVEPATSAVAEQRSVH